MGNDKPIKAVGNTENTEYIYCLRCGKRLRNVDAKIRGMGKVCWEKSQTEKSKLQKLF